MFYLFLPVCDEFSTAQILITFWTQYLLLILLMESEYIAMHENIQPGLSGLMFSSEGILKNTDSSMPILRNVSLVVCIIFQLVLRLTED